MHSTIMLFKINLILSRRNATAESIIIKVRNTNKTVSACIDGILVDRNIV